MTCFGVCRREQYKPKNHNGGHVARCYNNGWRGCTVCDVLILVDDSIFRCPCCNNTMRGQPRRSGNTASRAIRVKLAEHYVRY